MDGLPTRYAKAYIDAVRSEDETAAGAVPDEAIPFLAGRLGRRCTVAVLQGDTATQRGAISGQEDALIRTKIQVPTGQKRPSSSCR